jgi:hypothetical protein
VAFNDVTTRRCSTGFPTPFILANDHRKARARRKRMSIQQDKDDLLDALFALTQPGKRPSVVQAQMSYLPDWDRARVIEAVKALQADGEIMTPATVMLYVDLTSAGRKRAAARAAPQPSQTIHIDTNVNSPIQQVGSGSTASQNTYYELNTAELRAMVELYHNHVAELNLDVLTKRRADAQIATIEAELLQEKPDPTVIKTLGKSLKTIVEGAIGGAIGNVAANPSIWTAFLAFFS